MAWKAWLKCRLLSRRFFIGRKREGRTSATIPGYEACTSPYRPLDGDAKEIRLLHLEPGCGNDVVVCQFQYTSLTHTPTQPYETISYVWGDESLRGVISLHGQPFDVPLSTEIALKQVRSLTTKKILWIDAVCIDQSNIRERANQVALMADIYSLTSTTLISLGEGEEHSNQRADDSLAAILEDMNKETDNLHDLEKVLYHNTGDYNHYNHSKVGITRSDIDWESVIRYFENPWFTRLWVVQEVSLAPKSLCYRGSTVQPLENILRVAMWLVHKNGTLPRAVAMSEGIGCAFIIAAYADHVYGLYELLHNRGRQAVPPSSLLVAMRMFRATDEKDTIYGMLGLYKKYMRCQELPQALAPDYAAPLSTICRDVTLFVIMKEAALDILYVIRHIPNLPDAEEWPSWVARSTIELSHGVKRREVREHDRCADAHKRPDLHLLRSKGVPNILTVKGIMLGHVVDSTRPLSQKDLDEPGIQPLLSFFAEVNGVCAKLPSRQDETNGQLAHTLVGGAEPMGKLIDQTRSVKLYEAFQYSCLGQRHSPTSSRHSADRRVQVEEDAATFVQAFANACLDRRIFSTSEGYLGCGVRDLRQGDVVVIIYGCYMPLVLRPINLAKYEYRLVGYCWAYGVMQGEAVHAHDAAGQRDTIFHLV